MKSMILPFVLSMVFFATTAPALDREPEKREMVVAVNDVYVPSGFAEGDETFVVISGLFPNSCYTFTRVEVKHIPPATHEIYAYANVYEGICLTVLVPFSAEVKLGLLTMGDHTLRLINGDGTYWEDTLRVADD